MQEDPASAANPYQAPAAALGDVRTALPIECAGKGRRFLNWLIDRAVLFALTVAMLAILVAVDGEHWADRYDALGFWWQSLLQLALALVYYVALEGFFGISIGKLITGTRVVDERGRAPTPVQAAIRTLCRFIPFEPLSVAPSVRTTARVDGTIRSPAPMWCAGAESAIDDFRLHDQVEHVRHRRGIGRRILHREFLQPQHAARARRVRVALDLLVQRLPFAL